MKKWNIQSNFSFEKNIFLQFNYEISGKEKNPPWHKSCLMIVVEMFCWNEYKINECYDVKWVGWKRK